MKGGENDVFPSPSKGHQTLEPSIGYQTRCFDIDLQALDSFQKPPNMEHSKGHQTWNLPLATKLGTSLAYFLPLIFKGENWDNLFFFFWNMISNLNI
jgi:hypothetical protein